MTNADLAPGLYDTRTDRDAPAIVTVYALDRIGSGYRTRIHKVPGDAGVARVVARTLAERGASDTRISIISRRP